MQLELKQVQLQLSIGLQFDASIKVIRISDVNIPSLAQYLEIRKRTEIMSGINWENAIDVEE